VPRPFLLDRRSFLLTPFALPLFAAERKPNVVLVIASGWRGVSTPWNSDPDLQAPNLAKFADQSVVFPRAYSCDPQTDPGRSGILTGRYPHVNGVTGDGAALRAEEVSLDSVLKLSGYNILDPSQPLPAKPPSPFFLNVALAPPPVIKPVDAASFHLRDNVPKNMEADARDQLAKRYAAYSTMDQQFGKLLDAIDAANATPDTMVIFTSDHGEQILSHGLEDAQTWFEESTRIPFAIRFPRVLKPIATDVLASQVDILPTVLGFCGEPQFEGIQGRDLSPMLLGSAADRPESIFAEGHIGQPSEWRMIVVGSDKLVADTEGAPVYLFNLASDPFEMKNLAQDPSAQLKRDSLSATLRAARQRLLDFNRRPLRERR
jgi:arylsulfatase A-like enzyme